MNRWPPKSTKSRILLAIGRRGVVTNPRSIVTEVGLGAGLHNIVHQVWALQKQGLIAFDEVKSGNRTVPANLRLTARGRQVAKDIIE